MNRKRQASMGTALHLRQWVEMHGLTLLRLSVGLIFVWFGVLKFFPGSAAETMATDTISTITGGLADKDFSLILLGVIETGIGVSILLKKGLTIAVPLLYVQLAGTILPLFIFPDRTWIGFFMPSLEGQYIIKNLVLIAAGILIGAMARGSKLITHPSVAKEAKKKEERMMKRDES